MILRTMLMGDLVLDRVNQAGEIKGSDQTMIVVHWYSTLHGVGV